MPTKPWLVKKFAPTVTDAEIILHRAMAKKGWRFKTQVRIKTENGKFTVDFLFLDVPDLILEPKGSSHFGKTARRKDAWKTEELMNAGYHIMWIDNMQIYRHLPEVLEKIEAKRAELSRKKPELEIVINA